MNIWVDADACPVVIKEILFRAAERVKVPTVFVANTNLQLPKSDFISMLVVGQGFDVADREIVSQMQEGDLVITSDIPLAADVIAKGGFALSARGEQFSSDNIRAKLTMRNYMDELRQAGVQTGGQAAFSQTDRKAFADKLDALLARLCR